MTGSTGASRSARAPSPLRCRVDEKQVMLKGDVTKMKFMNEALNEQIAPEIVQAIIAQAAARGLSGNDYLQDLLGLKNCQAENLALAE